MPATLRFWLLSGTDPSPEGATFNRSSSYHEVVWVDQNRSVATTYETGIGNRVRLPRLTLEGSRFRVAEQALGLMSNLVLFSRSPVAQEGTIYVVQHSLPTFTQNIDNDGIILKWILSLGYSLMELTPHFNGTEMILPTGTLVDHFKKLVDNMPAVPLAKPYNGPRPTRFERILEDD